MQMAIPLFLLFSVYGAVNTYLPVLLLRLGYSATMIGVLQGIFEGAGLLFPVFVSARVDKKGNYGIVMIILALLMVITLPPLVLVNNFWVSAAALSLFSIGLKGVVPVSDGLVNRILGDNRTNYGKIRVMGSLGFMCITLLFQFTHLVNADSPVSIALWFAIPCLLFAGSVAVSPGLLHTFPAHARAQSEFNESGSPKSARKLDAFSGLPRSFWLGIGLIFFGFLGMVPSQRFFSLYVSEYLHLDSYAGLWALSVAAEVPFMFLSGYFLRKWGTGRLIVLSLLAITSRNIVYAVFPSFTGAIAGQLFHSICFGLFHPAAVLFIAERVPRHLLVVAMTLYSSVSVGIASVLGNIAGGILIDTLGYRSLFAIFSVFPLIGVSLAFGFKRKIFTRA